jgi:hypothetical protein
VDIRVWAHGLQQSGASQEAIFAAYAAAGGDAALAPAEVAGDTSEFLGAFVTAPEANGVSAEIVAGTYQSAGGRL